MTEVYIKYNPYRLETFMTINGNEVPEGSTIAQKIKNKRLQAWIGALPEMLAEERNTFDFHVKFHGTVLDWDDVKDAFSQCPNLNVNLDFEEAGDDSQVYNKIIDSYHDLMDGPFKDMLESSEKAAIERAVIRVNDNVFPIHVIATMSSGKSTLINALLQKKLMPSKNEACTAIITEVLDNGNETYSAEAYNLKNERIEVVPDITYESMEKLNENKDVASVRIKGDIPFLHQQETHLKLVDTPGPNNSRTDEHRETTYRNINSASENMILYILNYTQLATNDDANLLHYVAEEIRKGGRETRDRFLFVLNKMDTVTSDDSVPHGIEITKEYLARHGIEDPLIFPCSAFTALGLTTTEENFNDPAAIAKFATNPEALKLYGTMMQLIQIPDLHLEKYSTLCPSEQEKLNTSLQKAIASGDMVEQALIHSGIRSIESAIRAYVEKYAKINKIRDLVEPLEAQLNQNITETQAKIAAMNGGQEAEEIKKRSQAVQEMIQKGEEAKHFKDQLDRINPLPKIEKQAKKEVNDAMSRLALRFQHQQGNEIVGKKNALDFVNGFSDDAADVLSSLTAQMEMIVEKEITQTGIKLVEEYQRKLESFDKNIGNGLNFSTSDLVSGILSRMKANASEYNASGAKRQQQEGSIDDIHETRIEEQKRYVKGTKKVEKTVIDGYDQVEVGEREVLDHYETERQQRGTKRVQKKRSGFFGKIADFFHKQYEEEPIYVEVKVPKFRKEKITEPVARYKKVIEEIPTVDEVVDKKEIYVVKLDELRNTLLLPIETQLDDDKEAILNAAKEYIHQLKEQFMNTFTEIDEVIKGKYQELEEYTKQSKELEAHKQEIMKTLAYLEGNLKEIQNAMEI
ncbi:MAG: dynamin family protein [Oscillospiraceae bacterium]|nr:dynamin family protein [Oscillospiraceae bacterium]